MQESKEPEFLFETHCGLKQEIVIIAHYAQSLCAERLLEWRAIEN